MPRRLIPIATLLAATLSACGTIAPAPVTPGPLVRIEVSPTTLVLDGDGASATLTATGYDADGNVVEIAGTWRTLDPGTVTVDDAGSATAQVGLGSGQIVVEAAGVSSPPVLVVVASFVPGVVPLRDEQIVGDPTIDDPDAPAELGWRYRVLLEGVGVPDVGTLLFNTGDLPVAGRVVAASATATGADVVLELIEPGTFFTALVIDESLDLTSAATTLAEGIEDDFVVEMGPDGSVGFATRERLAIAPEAFADPALQDRADVKRNIAGFECELSGTAAPRVTISGTGNLTPNFQYDIVYDASAPFPHLDRIVLSGGVSSTIKLEPRLEAVFEGTLECNRKIQELTVPVGGPLALIFGGQVPIGFGFELKGKATVAQVGVKLEAQASITSSIGVRDCFTSCNMVADIDPDVDGDFKPNLPNGMNQARVELTAFGYGYAALEFGPSSRFGSWLSSFRFKTFKLRGGLQGRMDLRFNRAQADSDSYRSHFGIYMFAEAKADSQLDRFFNFLKLRVAKIETKIEILLDDTPTGTIGVQGIQALRTAAVSPGANMIPVTGTGEFTVTLEDRGFFPFPDFIDDIRLYYRADTSSPLKPLPAPCDVLAGGGLVLTCEAEFDETEIGEHLVYGFINPALLPDSLVDIVSLELNADSETTIFVDPEPTIDGTVTSSSAVIMAEDETPVVFTIPFDDDGENIAVIRATFELAGNPKVINLDWSPAHPDAAGFEAASGSGTIVTSVFVYCSEQGKSPITVSFELADEFNQTSQKKSTSMAVNYSGCSSIRDENTGMQIGEVNP